MIPLKSNIIWSELIGANFTVPDTSLATRLFIQRLRREYRNDSRDQVMQKCIDEAHTFFSKNQDVLRIDIGNIFGTISSPQSKAQSLVSVSEAAKVLKSGVFAMLAGSPRALMSLPKGNWIGGTIPYFMTESGGLKDEEKVFLTLFPNTLENARIELYDSDSIFNIPKDYAPNGISFIIMPGGSKVAEEYARAALGYNGLFNNPLVGWLSGTLVELIGKEPPLVFNGKTGKSYTDNAVVMHLSLPQELVAKVDTFNAFEQGDGPEITFSEEGFCITQCNVDGKVMPFADYIKQVKADTRFPLMGDYMGTKVNVAVQKIDEDLKEVSFYAPVFKGVTYRFAKPLADYVDAFAKYTGNLKTEPIFSCNCVLNFLYAALEGRKTGTAVGPMTFGEIAYILLNQTFVYAQIENRNPVSNLN